MTVQELKDLLEEQIGEEPGYADLEVRIFLLNSNETIGIDPLGCSKQGTCFLLESIK